MSEWRVSCYLSLCMLSPGSLLAVQGFGNWGFDLDARRYRWVSAPLLLAQQGRRGEDGHDMHPLSSWQWPQVLVLKSQIRIRHCRRYRGEEFRDYTVLPRCCHTHIYIYIYIYIYNQRFLFVNDLALNPGTIQGNLGICIHIRAGIQCTVGLHNERRNDIDVDEQR